MYQTSIDNNEAEKLVDSNIHLNAMSGDVIDDEVRRAYEDLKHEIEELVRNIRLNVSKTKPEHIMNFLTTMNFIMMLDKPTESALSAEQNYQLRSVEYVQSVLASTKNMYDEKDSQEDQEKLYWIILDQVVELYRKMPIFLLYWGMKQQRDKTFSAEEQEYIFLSQLMFQVRGKQYQCFRIPELQSLIEPHAEDIELAYGIPSEIIISGIKNLERNLSSGRLDALKLMEEQMDLMPSFSDGIIPEVFREEATKTILQVIGIDLFDIKKATNWPDDLINDLTYDLGEDSSFYSHDDFCGWPIWNLPVHRKPCIRINNRSYVFDYYCFFDYFYRSFQKATVNRIPDGRNRWNMTQTFASEQIVSNIFKELLPGCLVHQNNYYPTEKHNSAENDILVTFRDVLFIIEVKAGSFTYTPALTDFSAHCQSLKALVEKAEAQCLRTKKYIIDSDCALFYSSPDLQNEAFRIRKNDYSQIYLFDITIDSFNEIASQMEKNHIANTHEDIIVISLDDLWIYKEYFDNPLQFVHYIKQRTTATRTKEIVTFDELDHLGLYIDHNMYSIQAKIVGKGSDRVFFHGYREKLDRYFSFKHLGIVKAKPEQNLPREIKRILDLCLTKEENDTSLLTNFLLDMSTDTKQSFCESIHKLSCRESELNMMIPVITFGDISYCLYVNKEKIRKTTWEKQKEYILATLAKNKNKYCFLIELYLDNEDNIEDIKYQYLTQQDIPAEDKSRLLELGEYYYKRREKSFLAQNHKKKMGRNDPCPCGSGKKYKRCCGIINYSKE